MYALDAVPASTASASAATRAHPSPVVSARSQVGGRFRVLLTQLASGMTLSLASSSTAASARFGEVFRSLLSHTCAWGGKVRRLPAIPARFRAWSGAELAGRYIVRVRVDKEFSCHVGSIASGDRLPLSVRVRSFIRDEIRNASYRDNKHVICVSSLVSPEGLHVDSGAIIQLIPDMLEKLTALVRDDCFSRGNRTKRNLGLTSSFGLTCVRAYGQSAWRAAPADMRCCGSSAATASLTTRLELRCACQSAHCKHVQQ